MNMNSKTTSTQTTSFPNTDAPQAFREMAENGTKQAKETYEKMSAATTDAADLIKNSYSTAVEGVHAYNNKLIEFANANINTTFDFVQKLSGVNSPSAFVVPKLPGFRAPRSDSRLGSLGALRRAFS